MVKVGQLIALIRERGSVNLGEACAHINVGPWQMKRYAEVITDLCADVRWDGRFFQTIMANSDLNQRKVTEYVPGMRGTKKAQI